MASPVLESICCLFQNGSSNWTKFHHHHFRDDDLSEAVTTYCVLCVVSSSISVCGAAYQLFPRPPRYLPRTPREVESYTRQNLIICWLALADLLASLGILIRSAVWLAGNVPWQGLPVQESFPRVFCAVISAWIQYWYICTYMWTLCYTVDVYRLVNDKESLQYLYHMVTWVLTAFLTVAGLLPFYFPDLTSCRHEVQNWLPHYLFTYIPMLLVMIGNPILYAVSSKSVQQTLRARGLYTDHERSVVSSIKHKFLMVTLVFYVCWLPNILNSVLIILKIAGVHISRTFFELLWHFMAVVNPLQAFLNSIVYRNLGGCRVCLRPINPDGVVLNRYRQRRADIQQSMTTSFEDSTEVSPLLSYKPQH